MSKLEQNTTSLDEVLAMVNALPDAGGGGGGGTCTVTVDDGSRWVTRIIYQDALGSCKFVEADPITPASGAYTCVSGSIMIMKVSSYSQRTFVTENAMQVASEMFLITAGANGTAKITIT